MIDDQCPHCKEYDVWPNEDRQELKCKHCDGLYMGVKFGWCWHNVALPHVCVESKIVPGVCGMCGTSNKASTKVRIDRLKKMEGGEDLAKALEKNKQ